MKKTGSLLIAVLLVFAFSAFAWAGDDHRRSKKCVKKDKYSYYQKLRERIHKIRTKRQFRGLKRKYRRANSDAKEMFLTYLGSTAASCDEQVQALQEEYEQKITELNQTIAGLQQELDDLAALKDAECSQSLQQAKVECQADIDQQLDEQKAAHETDLAGVRAACNDSLALAQEECQNSCGDPDQGSGTPSQTAAWSTGLNIPYALDADDTTGNLWVLDRDNDTILQYDTTGAVIGQLNLDSSSYAVDIAVDSGGYVYVIDQGGTMPLLKFNPAGNSMPLDGQIDQISYPTGLYIDDQDRIYVADTGGSFMGRVLTLDTAGNILATSGETMDLFFVEYHDLVVNHANQQAHVITNGGVASFDLNGTGDTYLGTWSDNFTSPYGIAMRPNGDIIVADTGNNQIDLYDSNGQFIDTIANDVYQTQRIACDANGRLYVADQGNMQIRIFE